MKDVVNIFVNSLTESLDNGSFIKISFGNYQGAEPGLKKCLIREVIIKRERKLNFTFRYQTKDVVKNYSFAQGIDLCQSYLKQEGFGSANLFRVGHNDILQKLKNGKWQLKSTVIDNLVCKADGHNRVKKYKIQSEGKDYLHLLNITDSKGAVYKNAQNKFKQINHYIEILSSLLRDMPAHNGLKVMDMGAGKGYLTFALYDYLYNTLGRKIQLTGVEYRQDLVDVCNKIAKDVGYEGLKFEQGMINDFAMPEKLDVLIALHACDTATDDAIFQGIGSNAELIVVAPCCQKQIRKELEKNKVDNDLGFMTKHGVYRERHAEMLTDSMRALLMEYCGYSTRVFEFISDSHTPKNVLLVGQKKAVKDDMYQSRALEKFKQAKSYFGVTYHHLERLLDLDK